MAATPTPRGAATQMPPGADEGPARILVQSHSRAYPAAKPPKNPAPPKAAAPAAPSPLGPQLPGFTQPQVQALIQQALATQLPQRQAIDAAQTSSDQQARAAAQTLGGYYKAEAPLLAGIAPAVQGGYTQAAGLDAILGKGFGTGLQPGQTADTSQAQNVLGLSGGLGAQLPGVQQAIGGVPLQNALGWMGGGLPAQGLNQAGAAFGAEARMLPATTVAQGGQQIGASNARAALADQGFGQQRTDLAAQIPGLVAKYGATAEKDALAQQNADVRNRGILAGITGFDPATGKPTLAGQTAVLKNRTALAGLTGVDPVTGKPTLAAQATALKTRAAVAALTGYDPATGQLTPAAEAKIAAVSGYDPVTGEMTPAARAKIAGITGFDPKTGEMTPAVRAKITASTGYDPVTGKPTQATINATTTANARIAKETGYDPATGKLTVAAAASIAKTTGYDPRTGKITLAARSSIMAATGVDPVTGQFTAEGRKKLADVTGYDPVTGKPTEKTLHDQTTEHISAENAEIARQRAITEANNAKSLAVSRANAAQTAADNAETARINAGTTRAKADRAATPTFNATNSRTLHYQADQYGQPILDANGNRIPVTTGSSGSTSSSSFLSLTKTATSTVAKGAASSPPHSLYKPDAPADQQTKDAAGNPTGYIEVPGTGKTATPYQDMLAETIAMGDGSARWRKKATEIVNANPNYQPGSNGRLYTPTVARTKAEQGAQEAYAAKIPYEDAIAAAQQNSVAHGVPLPVALAALKKVYYSGPYSPGVGSPHFATPTAG